jgi:hypothetical protein
MSTTEQPFSPSRIVWYFNEHGTITSSPYAEIINRYAETAPTPRGIGRAEFVDEAIWARYDPDTGKYIDNATRYECCYWLAGDKRKVVQFVNTREEADAWLLTQAEEDFDDNPHAPEIFVTRESAEAELERVREEGDE